MNRVNLGVILHRYCIISLPYYHGFQGVSLPLILVYIVLTWCIFLNKVLWVFNEAVV